ncbi:MAG: hypothetical protein U5K43_08710 [Halofilum sp. (in: g-proteobacteria)]|nr:hypothetical protein [Halofilum sp. (in: g-proteobacteria)]
MDLDTCRIGVVLAWLAVLAWLFLITPENRDGGLGWTVPMAQQGWMAWVLPTALFFHIILGLLLLFSYLGLRFRMPASDLGSRLTAVTGFSSVFWARPGSTWPGSDWSAPSNGWR